MIPSRTVFILALVVPAAGASAACTPRAREETAMLVAAVDQARRAPDAAKAAAVAPIRNVPCDEPPLCEAKKVCVAFAEKTASGLALKAEVERTLSDVKAGKVGRTDPAAQALPGKLDEASRLLTEGEAALVKCDERLVHLKREWLAIDNSTTALRPLNAMLRRS